MPSETDVINVALRMIGGTAVSVRTDGSTNGNIVDDMYDDIRDNLVRSHNWNFATKRVELAELSTAPAFEFDNSYALPSDWIRTVTVHNNDGGFGTLNYRMELVAGVRAIVCSAEQLWMTYVAKVSDPNIMTSDFRLVLSTSLAAALALPVAASNTMKEQFSKDADTLLARAKAADAMGAFPQQRPAGSWRDTRGGYRTVWPG